MHVPGVQLIDPPLIESVAAAARQSARKRMNHNFHEGPDAPVHRFLNVLTRGTYIVPHRHLNPPKHESFLVLEGRIVVLVFDDAGRVTGKWVLADNPLHAKGIDLPAGLWHTVVTLSERAVCYEVKPGPWDPATDKEFAPWAPSEGDAGAESYGARLLRHAAG